MTNDEIRIAISEELGWNTRKQQLGGVFVYHDPQGDICATLPNYPEDLNACHEAWKSLNEEEQRLWLYQLFVVCGFDGAVVGAYHTKETNIVVNATAPQRCEAFLRVKGKWKEDVK